MKVFTSLGPIALFAALLAIYAPSLSAQDSNATIKSSSRLVFKRPSLLKHAGTGDVPTSGVRARVAAKEGAPVDKDIDVNTDDEPPEIPPEEPNPPIEPESEPPVEDEEPPTFFGEPVAGNFVFCLDRSGSMTSSDSGSGPITDSNGNSIANPNRMQIVKSEAIKVLGQLSENDSFALVSFGANPEWSWYPERVAASPGAIASAIQEVSSMNAYGSTPAYTALRKSCRLYNDGDGLDKLYFLCDGAPNIDSGAPGGVGTVSIIMSNFPSWWAEGPATSDCSMVCVHIGTSATAGLFMQGLANITGGIYVHH